MTIYILLSKSTKPFGDNHTVIYSRPTKTIFSRFSSNSEANSSELQENIEDVFPLYLRYVRYVVLVISFKIIYF